MSTRLAKQISIRMKLKNLSVAALEREAGLKPQAVQNILRGKSKKPSAESVQAIADVLSCTVRDLIEDKGFFEEVMGSEESSSLVNDQYLHPKLWLKTVEAVNQKIAQTDVKLTTHQTLICVEEVFLHSLQKDSEEVDDAFVDWFIDLVVE